MKFDIVSTVGKGACQLADYAGQAFTMDPACAPTDYPSIGWVALGLVALLIIAIHHSRRERRRRTNYLL
ncbi:MAG: hypothetical protein ABL973_13910 [Micropepsaceae bacterium]